jgi:hypothetical protein
VNDQNRPLGIILVAAADGGADVCMYERTHRFGPKGIERNFNKMQLCKDNFTTLKLEVPFRN